MTSTPRTVNVNNMEFESRRPPVTGEALGAAEAIAAVTGIEVARMYSLEYGTSSGAGFIILETFEELGPDDTRPVVTKTRRWFSVTAGATETLEVLR